MAFLLGNRTAPSAQNMGKSEAVPPTQDRMENEAPKDPSGYADWEPKDVAAYFTSKGYAEYAELWISHKISGERAVMLTVDDLKEMGVKAVGDRLGIQKELRQLKLVARRVSRNTVLAEHQQAYPGPCLEEKLYKCCCFCFPLEPDSYILTNSTLKIKSFTIARCCGRPCVCCGGVWENDTINLERITDIDTVTTLQGCTVCAERKCRIDIATNAGNHAESESSRVVNKNMFLNAHEGQAFAEKIRDAMDERRASMAVGADSV